MLHIYHLNISFFNDKNSLNKATTKAHEYVELDVKAVLSQAGLSSNSIYFYNTIINISIVHQYNLTLVTIIATVLYKIH